MASAFMTPTSAFSAPRVASVAQPKAPTVARPKTQQQTGPNALTGNFIDPFGQALPPPAVKAPTTAAAPRAASGASSAFPTAMPSTMPMSAFTGGATASRGGSGIQSPGNNLTNPGYSEQAFETTSNRLLEDPSAGLLQTQYGNTKNPTGGEQFINNNLGTLQGPGQGDQYWNQVRGQFNDPFAGEQFTREATQSMAPTGAAGAFNDAMQATRGQYTNFAGPQNTQGQYGQTSASLAGGTQGEQGLNQIAGQYNQQGQYTDPNLAAGQYAQTQGAFGDLPIAEFDPFYDRARQLATQDYNRQAAGRGVYGSSEALSGVGNVITDIEAQRANRSFDAEMQRAQEGRARQQLLGEQARMGDLSSLGAFGANLEGASTFANINNMAGNLELDRNRVLGDLANAADTQALGAQEANIAGVNAFGDIAGQADRAETDRFNARTGAMNDADRNALDRLSTGADIAFRGDENARQDYVAETNAANQAANLGLDRTRLGADIANTLSQNDLARLNSFNQNARGAEGDRQQRQNTRIDAQFRQTDQMLNAIGTSMEDLISGGQKDFEQRWQAEILPALQQAGMDQKDIDRIFETAVAATKLAAGG